MIFDQFEQFFVYTDDEARRKDFIHDLASCYNDNELADKVKILVSIREDWFARMDEIQEVLNYTLRIGSQAGGNSFYLKNFSAEEATMILKVMAQEDLEIAENDTERFDGNYIQGVLEKELISATVSSRDRLISPVDLQIIAETIKQQNTLGMRAFNEKVFQKLGGIEGLRRTFLENILEPLGEERKKSAIQVLVLLTNLENQTRAEVQTLSQLQEKVKGTIPANEAAKIVNYLHGTGLIAVVEQKGIKGYTLAHEGMISAVIRMGEKIQDRAYRVNQLLERRVNEWLGNNRSSRYLFNLGELWSIEKQKPYLIWGRQRQQKQQLLAQSKSRIYRNFGLLGGVLALSMGIWGWLNYTPWGQVTQIRWKLANVSKDIIDPDYQLKAVTAFAKNQNFKQACKLANKIEKKCSSQANANADAYLGTIAKVHSKYRNFSQAFEVANKMENDRYRADVLSAIVEAISKPNQLEEAAKVTLLKTASTSAKQIENPLYQANALRTIAEAYSNLNQPETDKAAERLKDAINSANQIEDSSKRADVLIAIAKTYSNLNQSKAAEVLQDAINSANEIYVVRIKANIIRTIAEAYSNLNQSETAVELRQDAIASANQIQDYEYYSKLHTETLIAIVEAYSNLNQPKAAVELFPDVIAAANREWYNHRQAEAFSAIFETISKLNQPETEVELFLAITSIRDSSDQAEAFSAIVKAIRDSSDQAEAFSAIVKAISKLNQPNTEEQLLRDLISFFNQFGDRSSRLIALAKAYSKLNQPKKTVELLQNLNTDRYVKERYQAEALIVIADAHNKLNQSKLAAESLLQAEKLLLKAIATALGDRTRRGSNYQPNDLRAIVGDISQLNQTETKEQLLRQAIASVNPKIQHSTNKADALSVIVEAITQLIEPKKAAELLAKARVSANQIEDSFDRANALRTIVEAYSELKQLDKAAELLQDALVSANQIEDPSDRANALRAIAEDYSKLNQPDKAAELLQDALASANQIEDSRYRAYALRTIAEAAANQKKWGQALKAVQQCPSDDCELELLAKVLTIYAEQQYPELKKAEDKNN